MYRCISKQSLLWVLLVRPNEIHLFKLNEIKQNTDHLQYFFLLLLFTVLYTALNSYKSQTCNKRKTFPLPPEVDLAFFRPVLTLDKEEKTKISVSRLVTGRKINSCSFYTVLRSFSHATDRSLLIVWKPKQKSSRSSS